MTMRPKYVYKISPGDAWDAALRAGTYLGSPDDLRDGFIHFSTAGQVPATAAKFFSRRDDLMIAAIDVAALGDALKWEASRGGALFPHLHSPLTMTAVVWTRPLPLCLDGSHDFPAEMI